MIHFFAATLDANQVLSGYGLAGLVIAVEAAVIIYINKRAEKTQDKYEASQEQRRLDAVETRDKFIEPLEKQTQLSEKTYDLLLNFIDRRGK